MKYKIFTKNEEANASIIDELKNKLSYEYSEDNFDLCICIGGDGTLLKAIDLYFDTVKEIGFLLINSGNIGFYSYGDINDLDSVIDKINQGILYRSDLSLLEVESDDKTHYALNDIYLNTLNGVATYNLKVDGYEIENIKSSGICVATSSGSTAFSASLGGALIDPRLRVMQITKISPSRNKKYASALNPFIVSPKSNIIIDYKGDDVKIFKDNIEIKSDESVCISYSAKSVIVLKSSNDPSITKLKELF